MSVTPAFRSPLPAVAIAAAFAAVSPAEAGILTPEAGATTLSEGLSALLAQSRANGDLVAVSVLDWVAFGRLDWRSDSVAAGDVGGHLAVQLDHVQAGIARLQTWSHATGRDLIRLAAATYRDAIATVRHAQAAYAVEARDGYIQIADAARAVSEAAEDLAARLEAGARPVRRMLTAFTLKAETSFTPAEASHGSSFARAATQPFMDAYASVLNIEARTRVATGFGLIQANLAKADLMALTAAAESETVPVSLHTQLVQRIDAALTGLGQLQAMLARNADIVAVAKAEFLRVLNDTTKLTLTELPRRDARRVLRTTPPVSPIPADVKPFGRRVDFDGMAHRYVLGEQL